LSLRANLLYWASLTPDLGLECRITPSWGWSNRDRRYALWEMIPEARRYVGKEKRGYLGAMLKTGEFNYKLSATGRQGSLTSGGLTGGYRMRLTDALMLDFSLSVKHLKADYDRYEVVPPKLPRGNPEIRTMQVQSYKQQRVDELTSRQGLPTALVDSSIILKNNPI